MALLLTESTAKPIVFHNGKVVFFKKRKFLSNSAKRVLAEDYLELVSEIVSTKFINKPDSKIVILAIDNIAANLISSISTGVPLILSLDAKKFKSDKKLGLAHMGYKNFMGVLNAFEHRGLLVIERGYKNHNNGDGIASSLMVTDCFARLVARLFSFEAEECLTDVFEASINENIRFEVIPNGRKIFSFTKMLIPVIVRDGKDENGNGIPVDFHPKTASQFKMVERLNAYNRMMSLHEVLLPVDAYLCNKAMFDNDSIRPLSRSGRQTSTEATLSDNCKGTLNALANNAVTRINNTDVYDATRYKKIMADAGHQDILTSKPTTTTYHKELLYELTPVFSN